VKKIEAAGERMMSMRLSDELYKLLVSVSAKMPATTPHAVARLALLKGLQVLDKETKK
jgi:hypothetical protein